MNTRTLIWLYQNGFTFDDILCLDIPYYKILQYLYYAYQKTGDEFFKQEYQEHCAIEALNDSTYMLIGDNHMGSVSENKDYLQRTLEFAQSLGIHSILHGGDIGDGMIEPQFPFLTFEKQVEHIISDYPRIEGVRHKIVLGNHDKKYRNNGYNLATILKEKRNDIDILGYGVSYLKLQSHLVSLEHGKGLEYLPDWYMQPQLRFIAHTHAMSFQKDMVMIPSLCVNDTEYYGIGGAYRSGCIVLHIENFHDYDLFSMEGYQFQRDVLQKTKEKTIYLPKTKNIEKKK